MINKFLSITILLILTTTILLISACSQKPEIFIESPVTETQTSEPVSTHTPRFTPTENITATFLPSPSPSITPTSTPTIEEPEGCYQPPEIYDLIEINGMLLNQRTYSMLQQAQSIYGGEIDLTGYHLTQGSYSDLVSASFGTHAGGGAVDISVIQYGTYQVMYDDIEPLIYALRVSGFAAWLRDFDQLYPGSPIHIHAIAIGDRDLSMPAKEQLTGIFGYFRGFNGLPQDDGFPPIPDEHGGPIFCQWMLEMGYSDLRTGNP